MTHALLTIEKLEVVYHRAITAVQERQAALKGAPPR